LEKLFSSGKKPPSSKFPAFNNLLAVLPVEEISNPYLKKIRMNPTRMTTYTHIRLFIIFNPTCPAGEVLCIDVNKAQKAGMEIYSYVAIK